MGDRQTKMAAALAALSGSDRARLERMADRGDTTPELLWEAVYQYGFDDMEESIEANIEMDNAAAAGQLIPHEELMRQVDDMLAENAKRKRRTA
ncbi:hypothetical protein HSX11_26210 [Oxalobacteraceae bacterium]|nr:hypothetical protein [Oxalobacteraceae bacterium]